MFEFRLRFHQKLVPIGRINNIPALVQMMACHRPGDYFAEANANAEAYMHHSAPMSYLIGLWEM